MFAPRPLHSPFRCSLYSDPLLATRLFRVLLHSAFRDGGDEQNRTVDPLLARQVLSQLSYTPMFQGFPPSRVPSP